MSAGRFLAALLLVALAACSSAGRTNGEAHVLRIAVTSDPSSLNPLLAHDQETIGYDLLISQTLVGLNAQNRLEPLLLTRIPTRANGDISPDGTRIVYHLRRNVRFADGVPLTSADVRFTYRALLDPRNTVLSQSAYRRIASLRTPDPYTVVIRLKHPWNAAVSTLFAQADFAFGILPAHAFSGTDLMHSRWENRPFGSGPFFVKRWLSGDRVILIRNPYFVPRPKLRRIELRMIPDLNTAFVALRTGEVDVAQLTPQTLEQTRAIANLRIVATPANDTWWLSLQTLHGSTSSLRVRRAVAAALDMSGIRKAYAGLYRQAGSFLPPVMPWFDAAIRPYPHDTAEARRLLGQKRVTGVLVLQAENPVLERVATIVQAQLAQAGIDTSIKRYQTTLFNAPDGPIRNARFTMALDGWLGGADPEQSIVFTCAQATPNGDNISRYCSPRFDALFADQKTTRSKERRARDFREMQQMIHRDLPVIPLFYETYYDGVTRRLQGFARNMLEYPVHPERWDVRP